VPLGVTVARVASRNFPRRDSRSGAGCLGMNSLRSIVVGLDFTPSSRAALRQAARIAAWNEADLHAVHVVDPTWLDHLCELLGLDRDRLRREAEEGTLVLRRLPGREQEALPLAEAVALLRRQCTAPDLSSAPVAAQ